MFGDSRIRQFSSGIFRGETTQIPFGGCLVVRHRVNVRHTLRATLPDAPLLILPLDTGDIIVDGFLFGADRHLVSTGRRALHALLPISSDHLILQLSQELLARHLDGPGQEEFLDLLGKLGNCRVEPARKRDLTRQVLALSENVAASGDTTSEEYAALLAGQLVTLLFGYLRVHQDAPQIRPSNHEKILERALQLIEHRPEYAFSLDEIARESFASKRCIQYAFTSLLGLSPIRYIKLNRLNHIREALRATPEGLTFTEVIRQHAFSNVGRLSREYSELFGEHPHETRQRALGAGYGWKPGACPGMD